MHDDLILNELVRIRQALERTPGTTQNTYDYPPETSAYASHDTPDAPVWDGETVICPQCGEPMHTADDLYSAVSEQEKPKSILDEEWDWKISGAIVGKRGVPVDFDDWKREIAALPDALRALKELRDRTDGFSDHYIMNNEQMQMMNAALKKAGIE